MKKILLATALLGLVPSLHAQQINYVNPSAGSLKAACVDGKVEDSMFCLGYISGWADMYTISSSPAGTEGERMTFRFQDGVTPGQIERMFKKYVEDHPEIENQPAPTILVLATRPVVMYMILDKNSKPKANSKWAPMDGDKK